MNSEPTNSFNLMSSMGVRKKTDGMCKAIDETTARDPNAKIDWFLDVEKNISSLVATKKKMKAVAIDAQKIAGEAKQLRLENGKLMLEKLWEYLAEEESAGAEIETS